MSSTTSTDPLFEKAYESSSHEDGIYAAWEDSGFFNPDICVEKGVCEKDANPFSMVLPPPNVTGTLHMGHAVMLAVQDVMTRYHRMKGDKTLWLPGTEHAAIATQSKVEKILFDTEGKTRHDLGRVEFLKRVQAFAKSSRDTIVNQSKKMGSSLDWSREAFTLDDERNFAVRTAFKRMYDDGLIYRGHRIVNWDPKMQCNVSNVEIEYKEEQASFYYFQYGPFVIGTARPETKFSDKYVLIHPDDERYKEYSDGDTFTCEWINGPITATIIKDEAVDPEFGSGVMTITPWHSEVDFHLAEKHNLNKEQIIDLNGKLLPVAGEFAGMLISDARKKIVEKLNKKGLLVRIDEEYVHNKATNYRGGGILEPQIREQWFLDVNKEFTLTRSKIDGIASGDMVTLKHIMQHVVRSNQIEIIPSRFTKAYFDWVDNLRDWCLSRQIWYGHQIPVWYKGDDVYCGVNPPKEDGWEQDPDSLDTWFSAGLWTFSTLGWPNEDAIDLQTFHPTNVLETGYDILTFWVIRMVLMGTYHMGEVPFKTVYLHGLVRDEQGRKMSKTLGNVLDPLDMTAKYGTDATRLSLLIGGTPGNDMKLSEAKVAGFRNFTNKLWNISRFVLMNIESPSKDVDIPTPKTLADTWILERLHDVFLSVTKDIEEYRFSAAGETLRDFTWNDLASWYLEIAKIEGNKSQLLNFVLNTVLTLWHPYMPFVTEVIWQKVYGKDEMLMVSKWPEFSFSQKATGFPLLQDVVSGIRSLRASYGISPSKELRVVCVSSDHNDLFTNNTEMVSTLSRLSSFDVVSEKGNVEGMASFVTSGAEVFVDLAAAVDVDKEKTRLEKEISSVAPYITSLEKKLKNEGFLKSAPDAVVLQEQQKLTDAKEKHDKLQTQLSSLM